jgi:hypothetical protein
LVIPAVYLYVDDVGKLFGRFARLIKR